MSNDEQWNPIISDQVDRVAQNITLSLPYNGAAPLSRFDAALTQCQLQADYDPGESRNTLTAEQLLAYPDLEYFRFNSAGNMVFRGERTEATNTYQFRTELRAFPEFSSANRSRMYGEMKLSASTLNEYTWMQIHEKPPSGSVPPPLRLAWEASRTIGETTYTDHLFAVFHRGASTYERIPLAERSDDWMAIEVLVEDGELYISINGVQAHTETVTAWADLDLYFKQGIYCTGSATAVGVATNETRALTLVVDEAIPDSVQVTVTGTGFGLAPNVVVYRTGDGDVGESFPATAPSGELGNAVFSVRGAPTYISLPGGITAVGVHDRSDSDNSRGVRFDFSQKRRFRVFHNTAVPSDAVFPGGKNSANTDGDMAHGEFSGQSGCKICWLRYDMDTTLEGSRGKADICPWTHIGDGSFKVTGNQVNPGLEILPINGSSAWSWGGVLNGFDYMQDCDAEAPVTANSLQIARWTSPNINGTKLTGTYTTVKNKPSFEGNNMVDGVTDAYQYLLMGTYSLNLNFDKTKTQIAWRDLYFAAESEDQANDWRQCVWLCNASTIEASTRRKAVIADSWSNTSVTVTVSAEDQTWATHVIVEDAAGNETAGAIV